MKIVLVGAGGYGRNYVSWLFRNEDASIELAGIVDKYLERSTFAEEIKARGIPVYDSLEAFYEKDTAELAMIATPTFLHAEQSICAVRHGSHVLCEKPAAPTAEAVDRMIRAERETGKFIAIGYQWSFSHAIQALKQDILAGVFGAPLSMQTLVLWPRKREYYQRGSGWGGRIEKDGVLVLDSIAANACAHYVHNLLFLLGDTMESSASLSRVEAECLRANAIENFDTCLMRMHTDKNVPLYFSASHAVKNVHNPVFRLEFERAVVTYDADNGSVITAAFKDGTERSYGDPMADSFRKICDCVECAKNGTRPICTVSTAAPHARLIEALYRNVKIYPFAASLLRPEDDLVYVDGLDELLQKAYEKRALLSELSYPDAVKTEFTM